MVKSCVGRTGLAPKSSAGNTFVLLLRLDLTVQTAAWRFTSSFYQHRQLAFEY